MQLPRLPPVDGSAGPLPLPHPFPVWPPLLASQGPGASSEMHSHHAMHFVLARSGRLGVRCERDGPIVSAAGVLTSPDVPHALEADGVQVLLVFLDPESAAGRELVRSMSTPIRILDDAERDALLPDADPLSLMGEAGVAWVARASALLGGGASRPPRSIHPRVRELLEVLRAGSGERTDLESLASAVGLSPGRLMHVFTESIGIPLRPYLTWLKLQRACAAMVRGLPLSRAAQEGGFADAAHMTRTVRRMLGVKPSELQRRSTVTD